jgi:hypothetical protein
VRFAALSLGLGLGLCLAVATAPVAQAGEHAVIRSAGDHPSYIFEAEPHVFLGFAGPFNEQGNVGLGFRGTFHIANGFVPSINDTVGIGVGFDFAPGDGRVYVPIVLQWNFWLSTHWSVFGEPGIAFGSGGPHDGVFPALFLGGRFNFTESIALTLRMGYPDVSLGVSFLL